MIPLRKTDVNTLAQGWEGCEDSKCAITPVTEFTLIQTLEAVKGAMSSICSYLACQEQSMHESVRRENYRIWGK